MVVGLALTARASPLRAIARTTVVNVFRFMMLTSTKTFYFSVTDRGGLISFGPPVPYSINNRFLSGLQLKDVFLPGM
jgi:hypothetical protein